MKWVVIFLIAVLATLAAIGGDIGSNWTAATSSAFSVCLTPDCDDPGAKPGWIMVSPDADVSYTVSGWEYIGTTWTRVYPAAAFSDSVVTVTSGSDLIIKTKCHLLYITPGASSAFGVYAR